MMTWKSLFLRIAKTAALIVPALLAVLALGFALLQTDMGKNILVRLAATALSKEASRKVELRGLSGWIPFNFQLQGLSVSDEQGLWLNVDDVSVRWSPFALLGGRLSIHEMTAHRVELLRPPQDQKDPHTQPPALPEWPGVLSKIQIERLAAERIVLGPALAGEPAVLSFEAKIGAEPFPAGEIQTLIRLEQIDRPGASLRIDALYKTKEQVLSIDGRFEEGRDGLAARLLGIEGPLAISLSGGGPVRDLEAELRAQAGGIGVMQSRILLQLREERRVLANGTVRLAPAFSPAQLPALKEVLPFSLSVRLPESGPWLLDRFSLEAGALSLDLAAALNPEEQTLEGRYTVLCHDLASLRSLAKTDLKGRVKVHGQFSGPLYRPQSTLLIEIADAQWNEAGASRAEVSLDVALMENLGGPLFPPFKISGRGEALDLDVSGFLLERARAGLQATFTPNLKQGDLSLDLFQAKEWIKARSGFSLDGHLLHLSEISITGFESTLTGRATLDLETPEARGEIRGSLSDLSLLLALVGQELHGSAKGEAGFRLGPGDRDLALSLEASSLESPFGAARGLQLKTRLTGTADRMTGSVDLEIRDGRSGDGSIALLAFKAQGDTDLAEFQLHAKGRYGQDFDVKTSGAFTLSKEVQRLALKHFQARYGPESTALPLSLIKPTEVIHAKGALRVEETSFTLGTGSFRGAGTYAARHVNFDLDFKDLPLKLLKVAGAPGLRGRASGSLALAGDPRQPEATFELLAVNLGLEEDYFPDLPDPSLDLKGSFSDRQVKADLVFRGLTPDPLKASVAFPLTLSLAPFSLVTDSRGTMEVDLHGEVPLPHVASLLSLDDQELGGRVEADLRIAGPAASPRVTGKLRMIHGSYENFRIGTILREATLLVTAENGRLLIQEARASDGEKGTVSLNGWFELSPDRDFPFHMDIALRDATLIRHDSVTATMGGDLVFAGNRQGAILSGEVTLYPLDVRIPRRLPQGIDDLEIIEIHEEKTQAPVAEARKPAQDSFAGIRLTILIPGRGRLSGRGLDSEWQGRLEIQGPTGDPSISGELSVVRGHFNFLGKRFNLTRGVVSFLGDVPPSPILSVTAEASTKEMTAFLELSGKVDSPELSLTSQPPLPDDEILSRLLFGRTVTQITPLQAIQLANALDVLAGRQGFDVIDHTRRMLGLDFLEIRDLGVELDEAALRAGKYLAENVYLEVEQGLGPESGRASLQWEITPNITIQTEVGINAEAGAGIRWKWDY